MRSNESNGALKAAPLSMTIRASIHDPTVLEIICLFGALKAASLSDESGTTAMSDMFEHCTLHGGTV